MSANKPFPKLSSKRPQGNLIGFVNGSSILLQVLLVALFQSFCYLYAAQQSWFLPSNTTHVDLKDNADTMESASVFLIAIFQYVAMAFVYSKGPPYRERVSQNGAFLLSLVILTALNIWLTVAPLDIMIRAMDMRLLDPRKDVSLFRISYVGLGALFFVVSYAIEVRNAWPVTKLNKKTHNFFQNI